MAKKWTNGIVILKMRATEDIINIFQLKDYTRGRGFGGDPHGRWMVLWDLMLGPGEDPVLNDLPLWELADVLLERRRVEFSGNDDDHLRGRRHCGRWSSRWRR